MVNTLAFAVDNKQGLRITSQRSFFVHAPRGVEDTHPSNRQRTEQSSSHICLSLGSLLLATRNLRGQKSRTFVPDKFILAQDSKASLHTRDCTIREVKIAQQLNFGRILTVGHIPLHVLSMLLCDVAVSATPHGSDYRHPVDPFHNYAT